MNHSNNRSIFFIGLRFFQGRESHTLLSFISMVSIVGLALSIALLIVVLAVMNGFEKEFRERILSLSPHATLYFSEPISDWQPLVEKVEAESGVTRAYAVSNFKALITAGSTVHPVLVQGMDVRKFIDVIDPYLLTPLTFSDFSTSGLAADEMILGRSVVNTLGLKPLQRFGLIVPQLNDLNRTGSARHSVTQLQNQSQFQGFILISTLDTGTQIDESIALMDLATAAKLSGKEAAIDSIQIQVDDILAAYRIAYSAAAKLKMPVRVSDWTRSYGNLYTAIQLSRQMVVLLLATIIAVAVFNIIVTLGMVVKNKQTEIAILRTMGFTRSSIMRVFMVQGMLIALPGCVLGAVLGGLLALFLPTLVDFVQLMAGVQFLQTDVYPINYLPTELRFVDIGLVCGAALLMSFLSTLYPAWKASRVLPAKALRYV